MHKYLLDVGSKGPSDWTEDERKIIKDRAKIAEKLLSNKELMLMLELLEYSTMKKIVNSGATDDVALRAIEQARGSTSLKPFLNGFISVSNRNERVEVKKKDKEVVHNYLKKKI